MSKGAYIGVSSKARKVKKAYIGVGGKARKVKKAYIGDSNGKARLWWSGLEGKFWGRVTRTPVSAFFIDNDTNAIEVKSISSTFQYNSYFTWCKNKYWEYDDDGYSYTIDFSTATHVNFPSLSYNYYLGHCSDSNNLYVLRCNNGYGTGAYIMPSALDFYVINATDNSYSRVALSAPGSSHQIKGNNGLTVLTTGEILVSPYVDGTAWLYNPTNGTVTQFTNPEKSGGGLLLRGFSSSLQAAMDNNGYIGKWTKSAFTKTTTRINYEWSFIYGNGIFVALDVWKTHILISSDLINWESVNVPVEMTTTSMTFFAYGDGKFILRNDKDGHKFYYSTDARTWTLLGSIDRNFSTDFCYDTVYGFGDK